MRALPGHRPTYHEWSSSTPIVDVARCLVAVASVVIGGYAILFTAFALRDANWGLAARYGAFLGVVAVANGVVDVLWRWRRHHG
ncbi:MAG: hypothetical protein QOH46_2703 [Solirubrobacteraceae bacterium]|jgi:hypothetical protein|nr:hypothetical protein [Solirubrobacteraceae bacterium]